MKTNLIALIITSVDSFCF